MNKVKVTATAILTLSPGVEFIEHLVSDGEDLGAHLKVGDKLYCPWMEWRYFEPRSTLTPEEEAIGLGHGYTEADDGVYDEYFASADCPIISHTMEVLEE